ncbi:hypothetical protein OG552_17680 [Streptomyces sp. NBC_01476]|uniref:DUF6907 domain-containing protein n=1 Tax=Streptomyces sp. NBC_01476 TaxID=2903881 RepID=UPI002E3619A4|nr:hypothetical protein [Streptomyces sp. NBC_01476]
MTVARPSLPGLASTADVSAGERVAASAAVGRRWVMTTAAGVKVKGYLPAWADCDPSMREVPLDVLPFRLADVCHREVFEGLSLRVCSPPSEGESGQEGEEQVLWGSIDCCPYAEEPERRQPLVSVALVADFWINGLDPEGLADLASLLRAQADRLEHEALPRLVAARADWAEHGSD